MTRRRAIWMAILSLGVIGAIIASIPSSISAPPSDGRTEVLSVARGSLATGALEELEVKGRASKTGYSRDEFGGDWKVVAGCSTRHIILFRDLDNPLLDDSCRVISGTLRDPYTGEVIILSPASSDAIQIDHVVALSDAWQKGAQQFTDDRREQLANDPLELLAVQGRANQEKSDADAASWLPSRKEFRCEYVSRQIAIKRKYRLWVTSSEKEAMLKVLSSCPEEKLPD